MSTSPSTSRPVVDTHTHFVPRFVLEEWATTRSWGLRVEERDGALYFVHEQGFAHPADETLFGGSEKLADMDQRGIDVSVLGLAPSLFFYWIPAADNIAFARAANDRMAETVAGSDGRFAGLAHLPMQDPEAAAQELVRAVGLGLKGAQIGTTIEGAFLDEPRFRPVLEAADRLGVPLMLHPYFVGSKPGLERHYLVNSFGNPLDTALAAARLIHSGVFDALPDLRFALVHGGGFLPYQLGRFEHAYAVRDEPRADIAAPPSEYLSRFWFDTITHDDQALGWLVDRVGADRVVLGTDLPYDMGDFAPLARLERAVPDAATRSRICTANATAAFGLDAALATQEASR